MSHDDKSMISPCCISFDFLENEFEVELPKVSSLSLPRCHALSAEEHCNQSEMIYTLVWVFLQCPGQEFEERLLVLVSCSESLFRSPLNKERERDSKLVANQSEILCN